MKKKIRETFKATAAFAANDAKARVPVLSGNSKRSIKPATSGAAAAVKAGARKGAPRKSAPYFGWLDFGGTIRPRGVAINRPIVKSPDGLFNGRYVYPAIKANMARSVKYLQEQIPKLLTRGA